VIRLGRGSAVTRLGLAAAVIRVGDTARFGHDLDGRRPAWTGRGGSLAMIVFPIMIVEGSRCFGHRLSAIMAFAR